MYDPLDGVVVADDATDVQALNRQRKRQRHWETLVGEWLAAMHKYQSVMLGKFYKLNCSLTWNRSK